MSRLDALRTLNTTLLRRLQAAEATKATTDALTHQLDQARQDHAAADLAATVLRAELDGLRGTPEALASCQSRLTAALARSSSLGAEVAQLSGRLETALGAARECVPALRSSPAPRSHPDSSRPTHQG